MDIERFMLTHSARYYAWGTLCAHPRDSLPFVEVLDRVEGMTSPATLQLLNHAVAHMGAGECYLEVGTWKGATLIGALLGNERTGYAIDNASMQGLEEEGGAAAWRENVAAFGMTKRAHYIDASIPAAWEALRVPPVGVYLFDGDKSTFEAARDGLMGVVPFLAPHAVLFVDDANTPNVREAVFWFCYQHRDRAAKILDLPTPANGWPSFWNGLAVIGWGVQLER